MTQPYTVLALSGSLRQASTNRGLLRCALQTCPPALRIMLQDLKEIPFFNADLEARGKPEAVERLVQAAYGADALLLACPEYNYSIAPPLKNALDWISREPDNAALNGKPAAIFGAGGGMGTARAQYHLRQVCVYLNLHPLNRPEIFAHSFSPQFDARGNVQDAQLRDKIAAFLQEFALWIAQIRR